MVVVFYLPSDCRIFCPVCGFTLSFPLSARWGGSHARWGLAILPSVSQGFSRTHSDRWLESMGTPPGRTGPRRYCSNFLCVFWTPSLGVVTTECCSTRFWWVSTFLSCARYYEGCKNCFFLRPSFRILSFGHELVYANPQRWYFCSWSAHFPLGVGEVTSK